MERTSFAGYKSENNCESENLLNHQNNLVGTSKIMSNAAKNFDILTTNLSVLHNYFNSSTKLLF